MVRQRKEKSKPRDAAEASKAPAKAGRPQKPRKGQARADGAKREPERSSHETGDGAESSVASTAQDASAPEPSRQGGETSGPAEAKAAAADEAQATKSSDAETATAAAAAATFQPSVGPEKPSAAESDTEDKPAIRRTATGLTATPLQADASPGDGAPVADAPPSNGRAQFVSEIGSNADDDAPQDAPEPASGSREAKPQPAARALRHAIGAEARPRVAGHDSGDANAGHRGAGDGPIPDPSWLRGLDAAVADQSTGLPEDDLATAASEPARAGMIDPSVLPAIDLSLNHAGPTGGHAFSVASAASDDATPPEARFAQANHENIVKSMRAEVLPNGGTMRLRLDPPQLGALQVTVQIRDGLVTAAFETSNDEATKLLGHSLNQLKAVLESQGVGVEKLQVQQAPRDERADSARDDHGHARDQTSQEQERSAGQEQQRKEMLRRMWRRLAGGADPLDVTV